MHYIVIQFLLTDSYNKRCCQTTIKKPLYDSTIIMSYCFRLDIRNLLRTGKETQMAGYKTSENYAYLDLTPHFLVFDEYVALMEMLVSKEST